MIAKQLSRMKITARKALLIAQGVILVGASLMPILVSQSASAATLQLTNRSVTESTAQISTAAQLVFTFTTTTKGATNVKQIEFEFCDTPLGSCAATQTPAINVAPTATLGGTWAGAGTTVTRVASRATPGTPATQINIVITTPANEDNKTLGVTIPSTTITNNASVNKSYYPRIRLYSDLGTTLEWQGSVAQSTSQTLTINARVAEQLSFCIGTTITDAIGANVTTPMLNSGSTNISSCTNADGTTVDLGSVSSSGANITPVAVANGGSATNAYAMIQTNAQSGATVQYKAILNSSSGRLKVASAACSGSTAFDAGSSSTDQCFGSSTTQTVFAAGNEAFGMTIAGVGCFAVPVAAYTCDYTTGNVNLRPQASYIGGTFVAGTSGTYATGTGFAWDQSGTAVTIASSAASTVKVIANESLMLKFAAGSSVTTPTGQYTTQADFIATPTF